MTDRSQLEADFAEQRRQRGAAMVDAALENGGRDNITIIVLNVQHEPGFSTVDEDTLMIAADGESWQRQWVLLNGMRADHDLVIEQPCATELRVLTGDRGPPPFALPGRDRAWLIRPGLGPVRVALPRSAER